jgi:hypothetical protein
MENPLAAYPLLTRLSDCVHRALHRVQKDPIKRPNSVTISTVLLIMFDLAGGRWSDASASTILRS